jgi:hypothetical protein
MGGLLDRQLRMKARDLCSGGVLFKRNTLKKATLAGNTSQGNHNSNARLVLLSLP